MRTMTAKFPGKCRDCGARIEPGDRIRYSKATGALCEDASGCRDWIDAQAEQAAEMRMERFADHRMAGLSTEQFFENEDYERQQRRRDDADYQRGYHEARYAQMAGPAGSDAREAAYREMEMAAYNRGDD